MSVQQPSVIDAESFTVRRTITVHAPVEKVWAAITEPQHLARWFSESATLSALEVGGTGTLTWSDHGDFPLRIEELDAPHSIAYRWNNESGAPTFEPGQSTVFRFTLVPVADGTELSVVESGFDALSDPARGMESNRGGWDFELDELIAYVEAGA